MSAESLVVARRDGVLIGVPASSVAAIRRDAGGVALRLRDGAEVAAESVEALAARCEVRPLPAAVRRRAPAGARGLALLGREPVVVIGGGHA